METNKITRMEEAITIIKQIFLIDKEEISSKDKNPYFFIGFSYKNILIEFSTTTDHTYEYYCDIRLKPKSTKYDYIWMDFYILLAYNDEEKFNLKYHKESLLYYFVKLKYYIDNEKLFFTYYNFELTKRFFIIYGQIKELPYAINLKNEGNLLFGKYFYKVDNNKPYYK